MSHVTNVILAYGITTDAAESMVVDVANDLCPSGPCLKRFDSIFGAGGPKAMEVNLALGAANYLDLSEWVFRLRSYEWTHLECHYVQLLVQGQNNDGFGSVHIWDDGEWSPGDSGHPDLFRGRP